MLKWKMKYLGLETGLIRPVVLRTGDHHSPCIEFHFDILGPWEKTLASWMVIHIDYTPFGHNFHKRLQLQIDIMINIQ